MMQVPPSHSLLAAGRSWPLWVTAIAVIAGVSALASVWMGRHHSTRAKVVWTVIVIVIPILGPLAWFALGRERRD
ncbi:MAG: PLDc N-terminal domain-containing protein [Gemmatimonadaceae bacterium]|nr:PLDc N-terminal domain-containing protein [Gemmatimonadaceae bacterium]